jgi:hypothetical protein
VTKTHIVWQTNKNAPHTPSPLLVGDELYTVSDRGVATCYDAKTGEVHWSEKLGGTYSASPLYADGKVYLGTDGGDLLVFAPHPVARCVDGLLHWRDGYFEPGAPRLGQVVTTLAAEGLRIRALEEYPPLGRRGEARVPAEFLLHAFRER